MALIGKQQNYKFGFIYFVLIYINLVEGNQIAEHCPSYINQYNPYKDIQNFGFILLP